MRPNDTKVSHWVEWFVAEHISPTPFESDGKIAATNGRYAVIANEPAGDMKPHPTRSSALARLLVNDTKIERSFPWDEFAAIVGAFPGDEQCGECWASGVVPHVCGCDLCDAEEENCRECFGTGRTFPDQDPVLLLGHPVDATLLQYLFAHLPPQKEIAVGIVQNEKITAGKLFAATFVLRAADWTAFLVGMTNQDGRTLRELLPAEVAGVGS